MQLGTLTAGSGIIARGAIGEAEIGEAVITSAHIKEIDAELIKTGKMQISSRNLIPNCSFKKGLFDWTQSPGLSLCEVNALIKYETSPTIHMMSSNQSSIVNLGIGSKLVAVTPQESYAASVYLMSSQIDYYEYRPKVELEFYDANGVKLFGSIKQAELTANNVWERVTIIMRAPSDAAQAKLTIYHPQNGETFIARPMLQKGSIVTEWIGDGSYLTDDGIYTGELNADQITSGRIRAGLLEIGPDTVFASGYSPDDIKAVMDSKIGYKVEIRSTKGISFRNDVIDTVLYPIIYKGTEDVTSTIDASRINWYRVSMDTASDAAWNDAHKGLSQVTIATSDVMGTATFLCEILENVT
jgi:hypothetical protein